MPPRRASDVDSSLTSQQLSHAHLISANHYADQARVDLNQVTKWLMAAPQVAKDKAPFFWTYLDRPRDGQIYLTWQPLKRLGTNFASDGMIWGPEQYHRQDVGNGLVCCLFVTPFLITDNGHSLSRSTTSSRVSSPASRSPCMRAADSVLCLRRQV